MTLAASGSVVRWAIRWQTSRSGPPRCPPVWSPDPTVLIPTLFVPGSVLLKTFRHSDLNDKLLVGTLKYGIILNKASSLPERPFNRKNVIGPTSDLSLR